MKKMGIVLLCCFICVCVVSCESYFFSNSKKNKTNIIENSSKPEPTNKGEKEVADEEEIDKALDEILDQLDELDQVLDGLE